LPRPAFADAVDERSEMRIAVIGRGNVGGGLARLWRDAGHDVAEIGRDGGDASDAEAVLLAVPSGEVENALGGVSGLDGKVVVDATNVFQGDRPGGAESVAAFVKSRTNGPVAKAFNVNFAALYDRLGQASSKPSNLVCGDDEARTVAEQLSRDAGYEPVWAGSLENARAQEDFLKLAFAINKDGMGPFLYRMARPEQL
jgi:8-hydroxy-5-deazaflavin:NADPH oxidoreductase